MKTNKIAALKDTIEFVWAFLYGIVVSAKCRCPKRVVIYYHSVKNADIDKFEKQMEYVAKHCHVVKASEIMTASANGCKTVVGITFDDAFVSVYENAVPVLKKQKLPAAIFVPTGNLGKTPLWALRDDCYDAKEIVMTEQQIVELDKAGFEIFSHTVTHADLTQLENDKLQRELTESKRNLEDLLQHEVIGVSYPHGACNVETCKAAAQAGYKMGFCIEPYSVDLSPDKFRIGRFKVSPKETFARFRLKISGAYEAARYLRKLKRMFIRSC